MAPPDQQHAKNKEWYSRAGQDHSKNADDDQDPTKNLTTNRPRNAQRYAQPAPKRWMQAADQQAYQPKNYQIEENGWRRSQD
jgi:hypothetical protein